ncbi:MAG: hypothetical protein HYY02_09190 [Chloroflexi bacterium]|nr:hypothetical protein [Chloroflexota bacterium]
MSLSLADLLNDALEAQGKGSSQETFLADHPTQAYELEPLLRIAGELSTVLAQAPQSEARVAALHRILAHATERPTGRWPWLLPLLALQRPAAVATTALLLLLASSTSAVVAAAGALPGDPLYPVKTGWEQVQLALAFDEESKARARLEQAAQRTAEIATLSVQGRQVPSQVVETLAEQTAAAAASVDKESLTRPLAEKLLELTEQQQAVLGSVAAKAPEAAKPALEHAIDVSRRGHQQAREALEKAKEDRPRGRDQGRGTPRAQPAATATEPPRQRERRPGGAEGRGEARQQERRGPSDDDAGGQRGRVADRDDRSQDRRGTDGNEANENRRSREEGVPRSGDDNGREGQRDSAGITQGRRSPSPTPGPTTTPQIGRRERSAPAGEENRRDEQRGRRSDDEEKRRGPERERRSSD